MGDDTRDDTAWLALLDGASEPSAELLSVLFANDRNAGGDGDVARADQGPSASLSHSPSSSSPAKKPPRKRSRRSESLRSQLLRLRLEAADLENVCMLLTQRHAMWHHQGGASALSLSDSDQVAEGAWKAAASRQLQRLSSSKVENQRLHSALLQQLGLTQQLVRLVQRAQHGLPLQPVPRSPVPSDVVTLYSQRRAELMTLASQMVSSIDAVVANAALQPLADEFSRLTVDEDVASRREIPCGAMLGGAVAGRFLPYTPQSIADHLWRPHASNHALTSVEYDAHTAETHASHYTIIVPSAKGSVRLLGVTVRLRIRDATRDTVIAVGSLWPDANMPYPWNAIGYTTRDWVVAQRDPRSEGCTKVLMKTERLRFVHELGTAAVTRDEAAALRHSIEQANTIGLDRTNRRLDALLLQ